MPMKNEEAVEMMNRCKQEIVLLRAEIARLAPKAEAYDNLARVLNLLPQKSVGMGEDLVWLIDRRIRELEKNPADQTAAHDRIVKET